MQHVKSSISRGASIIIPDDETPSPIVRHNIRVLEMDEFKAIHKGHMKITFIPMKIQSTNTIIQTILV